MTDREPRDVVREIKDWLKADLASRFPGLSVALVLPSNWSAPASNPVLLVEGDGDPLSQWPVATSPTVRVTSWTSGRNLTYIHAAMTRLLTARVPGLVILRGAGVLEARDSKTKGDLASFTVRTRARTAVPSK